MRSGSNGYHMPPIVRGQQATRDRACALWMAGESGCRSCAGGMCGANRKVHNWWGWPVWLVRTFRAQARCRKRAGE